VPAAADLDDEPLVLQRAQVVPDPLPLNRVRALPFASRKVLHEIS